MSETSPYIGTPLLWFYIVIAQILLVNLLIAMNSTYTNYTDRAQRECYFDRVRSLVETDTLFPVPPPLNLPALVLRKLWQKLWQLVCCSCCDDGFGSLEEDTSAVRGSALSDSSRRRSGTRCGCARRRARR